MKKNLRRYLRNKFSSYPIFLTTVIEETIFSSLYSLASLSWISDRKRVGFSLHFLLCSMDMHSYFCATTVLFDHCGLQNTLKSGSLIPSALFFLLKMLWLFSVFFIPYKL